MSRSLGRVAFVRGFVCCGGLYFWRARNLATLLFRVLISRRHRGLSLGLLVWERDERRPPPQILSFLPPCLHSKSMTSGVSGGGGDQPIRVELRTDRSLSPFCCSGQSATKEGCCGLIPINLPGVEACQDCHRAVPPLVECIGIVRAVDTQKLRVSAVRRESRRSNETHRCQTASKSVVYSLPLL